MDEFIKMLNADYELWDLKLKILKLFLKLLLLKKSCTCLFCNKPSSRVHSTYQCEIQDLPLHDKQTVLLVNTRKMFCENPNCQATMFTERHPFVAKNAKKTNRLVKNILNTSYRS